MAHPKPSSRLLCQLKKGTRSAPLLDLAAIGGVGWGVKGGFLRSTHAQVAGTYHMIAQWQQRAPNYWLLRYDFM